MAESMGYRSMVMRRFAESRPCTIGLHPHCTGGGETSVMCHLPSVGKGMGFKSPDWWAVIGCWTCHDLLDGRKRAEDVTKEDLQKAQLRALYHTLSMLIDEGLVQLPR